MAYFPQINSNLILTQLPYSFDCAYESVVQDVETGMRYAFPRRAGGLTGYPSGPLCKFGLNYPNISDAEVTTLLTFFRARRGRLQAFRFLDPGGNLIQYSEDYSQAIWNKAVGPVSVGGSVTDPFGGTLATSLTAGAGNSYMTTLIGPADGGMSGFRITVSLWVNARDAGTSLYLGIVDSGVTHNTYTIWTCPYNAWRRIHHSVTLTSNNPYVMVIGGGSTWTSGRAIYMYGAQASPMKGPGAYVRTPGNYGYHANCRFDTDDFEVKVNGPGENQILLPVIEVNT